MNILIMELHLLRFYKKVINISQEPSLYLYYRNIETIFRQFQAFYQMLYHRD